MHRHRLALVGVVLLASAALAAPPRAEDTRQLALLLSNDGTVLTVADSGRNALAIYRINANAVVLLSTRNLNDDLASPKKPAAGRATVGMPGREVPGEDPPDFARLTGAVRTSASLRREHDKDTWQVEYLVPGTLSEVYEKLRAVASGWNITSEEIRTGSWPGGEIHLKQGLSEVNVGLTGVNQPDGWIGVTVQQVRRKS